MGRWTDRPLASSLADADTVLMADMSEAAGTRDRQATLGQLRTFLGAGITVGVTQASHGLSVGDVVRFDGSDYVQASADTDAHAEAVGVVSLVDGDDFAFQTAGVVSTLSGLTGGDLYYLQDDGTLDTTPGTVEKPVLIAISATSAVLVLAVNGAGAGGGAWGGITGTLSDQTDLQSALNAKLEAATPVTINAQTGTTYTLVLGDAGKLVTLANGSAITLTVPANSSAAFPVGTVIALAQLDAGLVTVAGDAGVTINGTTPGDEDLTGQWITATLTKLATNNWLLSGGLA
jgi:hypothetical protein